MIDDSISLGKRGLYTPRYSHIGEAWTWGKGRRDREQGEGKQPQTRLSGFY